MAHDNEDALTRGTHTHRLIELACEMLAKPTPTGSPWEQRDEIKLDWPSPTADYLQLSPMRFGMDVSSRPAVSVLKMIDLAACDGWTWGPGHFVRRCGGTISIERMASGRYDSRAPTNRRRKRRRAKARRRVRKNVEAATRTTNLMHRLAGL